MSIKSIVKINEGVGVDSKPRGWVVRELLNKKTGKVVVFELGIYINENTFLGIPIHYSFKDKLVSLKSPANDKYTYYLLKDDVEFSLGTFKSRGDKIIPMLMQPTDEYPAVKVACIAQASEGMEKILHSEITRDDNIVVRDYIDKDRNSIAIIVACNDKTIVNPSIGVKIATGVVGSKSISIKTYDLSIQHNISTDVKVTTKPVETRFIKFKRFIRPARPKTETDDVETNESTESNNK